MELNESRMQRIEMQNFNGLQQWNTEVDRLKELLKLELDMGDPTGLASSLRTDLKAHLNNPFSKKLCVENAVSRAGATPKSANLQRILSPLLSSSSTESGSATATASSSSSAVSVYSSSPVNWEENTIFD